jgi:hypothetical protein
VRPHGFQRGAAPTKQRQTFASSASAQPSTCRGSFLCKMGYLRIRSAYGSGFKPRIRSFVARH